MNRSFVAALALVAGAALASPIMLAPVPAGAQAQTAQPAPAQSDHGGMPGMMGRHEGMWHHGMMGGMREMMMRRWAHRSPAQHCEERIARRAGMIAYTVAKLNLTAEQRPLWDKLNAAIQAQTDKGHQLCASLKSVDPEKQTILDRTARREQVLSTQLQALQQVRPSLEALYNALSPEQKEIVNHPFRD